jgi:hypothetical protein
VAALKFADRIAMERGTERQLFLGYPCLPAVTSQVFSKALANEG